MTYEKSCGAVVFTEVEGEIRYLLVSSLSGAYGFPKGHMEKDETEEETALREVLEETNLNIELISGFRSTDEYQLTCKKDTVKTVVYFLGAFKDQSVIFQKEELSGACLVSYSEATGLLRFESLKRILNDANDYLKMVSPACM